MTFLPCKKRIWDDKTNYQCTDFRLCPSCTLRKEGFDQAMKEQNPSYDVMIERANNPSYHFGNVKSICCSHCFNMGKVEGFSAGKKEGEAEVDRIVLLNIQQDRDIEWFGKVNKLKEEIKRVRYSSGQTFIVEEWQAQKIIDFVFGTQKSNELVEHKKEWKEYFESESDRLNSATAISQENKGDCYYKPFNPSFGCGAEFKSHFGILNGIDFCELVKCGVHCEHLMKTHLCKSCENKVSSEQTKDDLPPKPQLISEKRLMEVFNEGVELGRKENSKENLRLIRAIHLGQQELVVARHLIKKEGVLSTAKKIVSKMNEIENYEGGKYRDASSDWHDVKSWIQSEFKLDKEGEEK